MKNLLKLFVTGLLVFTTPAFAQTTASNVQPGNLQNAPQTNCKVGPCFVPFSSSNPLPVDVVPSTIAGATHAQTSALAANLVVKASAGNLYDFEVSADSTLSGAAWWIMIYDATSAPADGAVTPAKCYAMPSGSTTLSATFPTSTAFTTGITIGVSTTGCFNKTASTHAFIAAGYQ